ncbi:DUF5305 domain-containing protein [Halomicrobium sp. IBSBa]|uniref:DUF5305 domain-containing protein n=1 Tax=Halomicrobium sp. IBSBa TaxID=2778916 RepID=UPI001ABF4137|nr:DUF5305 domain-containing protein [Halomicrobium sp. IBSBa]MBO4248790.1 DUF5305 domain-containing protein [Halomicrobium sp. IBSBa]
MGTGDGSAWVLRSRHLLAQYLAIAVVVCLVLAGAGGFVAYAEYSAPDTTTEQRVTASWTTDSSFAHQATVERSTRAFEAGTVLRNRSAYLFRVTPALAGEHRFRHEGAPEAATVATDVRLVKRSIGGTGDDRTEFWRVTDSLASKETTVAPGESARTSFRVNVSQQRNETRQIERELGGTPGRIELFVRVTTRVTTTVDGEQLERSRTERLTIRPGTATYAVAANTTGRQEEPVRTETVSVPVEKNTARIYGGAAFAAFSLLAAAGLVFADRRDRLAVPPETVAALQTERTRDRFDEWISVGRVPEPDDDERVVTVDSLADLVDVAIDSDRRVIEDGDDGRFVVLVDRVRYCYEPRAPTIDSTDSVADGSNGATDAVGEDDPIGDDDS